MDEYFNCFSEVRRILRSFYGCVVNNRNIWRIFLRGAINCKFLHLTMYGGILQSDSCLMDSYRQICDMACCLIVVINQAAETLYSWGIQAFCIPLRCGAICFWSIDMVLYLCVYLPSLDDKILRVFGHCLFLLRVLVLKYVVVSCNTGKVTIHI